MKKIIALTLVCCLLGGYVPSYAQTAQIDEQFAQKRSEMQKNLEEISKGEARVKAVVGTLVGITLAAGTAYLGYKFFKPKSSAAVTVTPAPAVAQKPIRDVFDFLLELQALEAKSPMIMDDVIEVISDHGIKSFYRVRPGTEEKILEEAAYFIKHQHSLVPLNYSHVSAHWTPATYHAYCKESFVEFLVAEDMLEKVVTFSEKEVAHSIGLAKAGKYLKAGAKKWTPVAMFALVMTLTSATNAEASIARRIEESPEVLFDLTDEQAAVVANSNTLREMYFDVADQVEKIAQSDLVQQEELILLEQTLKKDLSKKLQQNKRAR